MTSVMRGVRKSETGIGLKLIEGHGQDKPDNKKRPVIWRHQPLRDGEHAGGLAMLTVAVQSVVHVILTVCPALSLSHDAEDGG